MTKFVAALLIARGPAVRASVDPRTRYAAALGQSRSAALLVRSVTRARRELTADEVLEAQHAAALREAPGVSAVVRDGQAAWEIHQRRGGAS